MMRRGISNLAVALCLSLTSTVLIAAEDVPTITVSKGDQINLSVSPLDGGEGGSATKTVHGSHDGWPAA